MAMDLHQANDNSKVSHMTSAQKKSFHQYTLEVVHGSWKNDFGHNKKQISPGLQSEVCRFVEIPKKALDPILVKIFFKG